MFWPLFLVRQSSRLIGFALVFFGAAALQRTSAQVTSGTVSGTVFYESGRPAPRVKVTITNNESGNKRSMLTDNKGRYRRSFLPPGYYLVVATSTGHSPGTIRSLRIEINKNREVEPPPIRFGETAYGGTVVDSHGQGLSGVKITLVDLTEKNIRTMITDEAGDYFLPLADSRSYQLIASKPGYFDSILTVSSGSGDLEESLRHTTLRRTAVAETGLSGRVEHPPGTGVADANVRIENLKDGTTYNRVTDANGYYSVSSMPPGIYRIAVNKSGFEEHIYKFEISSSDPVDVVVPPLILTASPAVAPVSVPVPPVVTDSSAPKTDVTRSGNFDDQQLDALPLGGSQDMRTFDDLALLLPGVSPPPYTPGIRGPGVGFGVGTAGKFSVNGMRARSNNFSIDGSDNNDPDVGVRRQGFVALVPQSAESIKEFQVATLLWDAELGRNFGGQVNAVSRYGGNKYHGQIYSFLTDSRLNARNFFDYTGGPSGGEDPFTRTQTGFVASGPIASSRTHFFGSFEHLSVNTSKEQHFSSPRADERQFLGRPRSGVLNPLPQEAPDLFFRTTTGTTPLGSNVLSFYPGPNNPSGPYGNNNYTEVLLASGSGELASMKVTNSFGENKLLSARYNFTNDHRFLPSVNRAIRSTIEAATRTQNLSLIYDTDLTSKVFSQWRFSYGRTRLNFSELSANQLIFSSQSVASVRTLGSPVPLNFSSNTGSVGEIIIEPFSPVGVDVSTFPQKWIDNTFQYAGAISTTWSTHAVKFGADIRRVHINSRIEHNYRPRLVYGNAVVNFGNIDFPEGQALGPFMPVGSQQFVSGLQLATIGLPSSIFQTITSGTPDPTIGLRFTEYSFFINDNWRIRSNLSLDFGLRYDYNSVPIEVNDRIESALRLDLFDNLISSTASAEQRMALADAVDAYRRILAGRTRIYDPDGNNFGPHVGFAWAPGLESKGRILRVFIRGGYGIYYDAILGAVISQSRNVFPNEIPINIDPTFGGFDVFNLRNPSLIKVNTSNSSIPLVAPNTINQFGGSLADLVAAIGEIFLRNRKTGGLAFTLPAKDLRTPYAQQCHITLDLQLKPDFVISAAYVGTKGTKLTRLTTPNLGPNVTTFIPVVTTGTLAGGTPFPIGRLFKTAFLVIAKDARSVIAARPQPALGPYQILENSAASSYSALQLEARKQSRRYTLTASYTWSHAIDDVSDIFPIAGAPILPQNSLDYRLERASANYDIRHRFAASLVWDIPLYECSNKGLARWFGCWQLASIFQANTGQPFTVNVPADANFDGNLTDRPSSVEGLTFLSGHNSRRITISRDRTAEDFFIFGQDGLIGRNIARGDGFINLDVSLKKNFVFAASNRLEFRVQVFNLLNRANFGLPVSVIGAPAFGSSVETVNPARIIEFALKLKI